VDTGHPEQRVDTLTDTGWVLPIRVDLTGIGAEHRPDAASAGLRARPGVVAFVGSGRVVMLGSCADLRAFASSRLRGEGRRADLAGVTDTLLARETGSGFEADWAHAVLSRGVTPERGDAHPPGNLVWFIRLDPESLAPACRVLDSAEVRDRDALGTLIGPFGARGAAEAFARLLDERFALCREPALLVKRPDAIACVYKEMGRCPAPCDGSESIGTYRARVRAALDFAGEPLGAARAEAERRMHETSSRLDFEAAAGARAELALLEAADGRLSAWATTMDRFGVLGVMPAGKAGWARLILHRGGCTRYLADVRAREPAGWRDMILASIVRRPAPTEPPDRGWGGEMGVVCRHLFATRNRRGGFLRLDPSVDGADLVRLARRAAGLERTDSPEGAEGGV
jgi:DNA polymerase-3 subunit epsilon